MASLLQAGDALQQLSVITSNPTGISSEDVMECYYARLLLLMHSVCYLWPDFWLDKIDSNREIRHGERRMVMWLCGDFRPQSPLIEWWWALTGMMPPSSHSGRGTWTSCLAQFKFSLLLFFLWLHVEKNDAMHWLRHTLLYDVYIYARFRSKSFMVSIDLPESIHFVAPETTFLNSMELHIVINVMLNLAIDYSIAPFTEGGQHIQYKRHFLSLTASSSSDGWLLVTAGPSWVLSVLSLLSAATHFDFSPCFGWLAGLPLAVAPST